VRGPAFVVRLYKAFPFFVLVQIAWSRWNYRLSALFALKTVKAVGNAPLETRSDGYATGLIAFVLQDVEPDLVRDQSQLGLSLAWLKRNQVRQKVPGSRIRRTDGETQISTLVAS
jgi:hypothetical protein